MRNEIIIGNCPTRERQLFALCIPGSFCVEYALVFPLILGVVFSYIFCLFYLHDQVVLYGEMTRKMIIIDGTEGEFMPKGVWMVQLKEASIRKKTGRATGEISAQAQWNLPLAQHFTRGMWKFSWKETLTTVRPSQARRIRDILKKEEEAP